MPSRMGRLNKRALLSHLHRMGTASRAELAKSLGLSQPTAGKIVDQLLEMGIFEEVPTETSRVRVGRPARMLRISRSQPHFLTVQFGVEKIGFALPAAGDLIEDLWTSQIQTPDSAEVLLERLRETAGKLPTRNFWGVLVSVPGVIDQRKGCVLYSPNLHWTEQTDLPGLFAQIWKAPVLLVQEGRALALGHQSANPEGEDFLLIDVGEGVGGSVVMAGKLPTHPLPISCELGHTPVAGNLRRCGCGAAGCIETLLCTRGLLQSFQEAHPQAPCDWESMADSILRGGIQPWLAQTLEATATVIAGALNVLGVRRVVLTGHLTSLPSAVIVHLTQAINKGALWARFGEVTVETAPRRRMAGLVAAGLDQLVLPIGASEHSQETQLHISAFHDNPPPDSPTFSPPNSRINKPTN